MNGYCKLTVEGVEHTLYFGRQAVEEFALRTEKHLSANGFKIAVDMVYAGIANNMTKLDLPPMSYSEVYELLEKLADTEQENWEEQYNAVSKCFWESKYGAEYQERLADLKKKIEEEMEMVKDLSSQSETTGKT